MRPVLAAVVGCAIAVAACDTGEDVTRSVPEIVGAPVEIEEAPRLALGVLEGDTLQEFHRVVTPFLMFDGRLVVPVAGAGTIRVFGPDGEFLMSLGRPGKGPGEFQYLLSAWPRGDTIEALDFRLRRIARFFPDGSMEDVVIQSDLPDLSVAIGPLDDGGWAVAGVARGDAGMRDQIAVRRVSQDGVDTGEIARGEGMVRYATDEFTGPEPLSPRAIVAVGRGRILVGEGLTPRVVEFDPSGAQLREYTWEVDGTGSPGTILSAVIDSAVAMAGPDRAAATRRRLEGAPAPQQLPVYWKILVDGAGFVWIRPYEPFVHSFALGGTPGAGGRWLVLSPDGAEAGTVMMPPGIEPVQITMDAVVGIARDASGVESVRVHALHRR